MAMREIFRDSAGLTISVDTDAGKARVAKVGRAQDFSLPLNSQSQDKLPDAVAKMVRKAGQNPADYFWVGYAITRAAKTAFDAALAEYAAKRREAYEAQEADLEAACPGLARLRAAREDEVRYTREFNRMMADEDNDGARPPRPAQDSYAALAAEYPRAALYLKAEDFSCAANDHKAAAGSKAIEILAEGGSEAEARAVLDNWMPKSAYTD